MFLSIETVLELNVANNFIDKGFDFSFDELFLDPDNTAWYLVT